MCGIHDISTELYCINATAMVMFLVPLPTITVTYPNTPTVGRSLRLNCRVTTVTGITSTITVRWTSCGRTLLTTNIAQGTSTVFYDISQLTTDDQGKVYHCEVAINTSPTVTASSHITLSVNGKWCSISVYSYTCYV